MGTREWTWLLLLLSCLVGQWAAAADKTDPEKSAAEMVTPAVEQAIDKGLAWLAQRQNDDGSFGTGPHRGNVGICGLCGMAFMTGGSTPGRGPYGDKVDRAVDYLLANSQQSGFILEPATASHGPMYNHGFATLFLAECYGMSPRPSLREKLSKAVRLIVNTQNKEGGWRYFPKRDDADLSVTSCEVMALRAARNAGLYVPIETFDRAREYVKRCQNADGGFMYMASAGGDSSMPRSAAAVVALAGAGVYEAPEVTRGLDYLVQFVPGVARQETYYEYGQYYAVQAMWLAGGQRWAKWYPAVRDELVARQRADGSWMSAYGAEYATAMCLMVLQMPENQLPIFQR
ncbi:MAG: prenyltransferase/squalene oxidase repeat-containing protein [Thermoguttaceae bacterium]